MTWSCEERHARCVDCARDICLGEDPAALIDCCGDVLCEDHRPCECEAAA